VPVTEAERSKRLVTTHDLEEAHEHITQVYIPHGLESRDGRPLDFKLRYLASDRLTIGHLRYGADAELLVPPMVSCYHVNLTLHGATMVTQGGNAASTEAGKSGVLFNPMDPFTVRWSPDAVQYAIKVPRGSLEGQLSALVGRPIADPIKFDLGFALTSPTGQSLVAAVQHLRTELSREGGIAQIPLVRAQLESYVLSQMLLTIPHEYRDLILTPADFMRRRHVRLAMEYIDEHAGEAITGPDIARAACVSVRALQAGFHEELAMAPMTYLRNVRLDHAHADLLAGPADVSVSEVATRWGFWHLGRFAEQYRRKFGVLPSETIKARR
jgi:AraC-like DNA-binding protein